jgi:hypothetical protein
LPIICWHSVMFRSRVFLNPVLTKYAPSSVHTPSSYLAFPLLLNKSPLAPPPHSPHRHSSEWSRSKMRVPKNGPKQYRPRVWQICGRLLPSHCRAPKASENTHFFCVSSVYWNWTLTDMSHAYYMLHARRMFTITFAEGQSHPVVTEGLGLTGHRPTVGVRACHAHRELNLHFQTTAPWLHAVKSKRKVKLSLQQAVEAFKVVRCGGSHIG